MTTARDALTDLRTTLEKMGGQFRACFPTDKHVDRFIRVVMTAVQSNLALLEAERTSFYAACMKCAQDGLLPDGKQAVLKIYKTKVKTAEGETWVQAVQYEPMTDGLMVKLRNSGEIVGAPKVHPWYEHDDFDYQLGDDEKIVHRPAINKPRGRLMGAYSIVKLKSGDTSREIMSIEEIDEIMRRTKSKDKDGNIYGPWKTDKPEMARKTVFKRHVKRLPRSTDLDNVINYDNEQNGVEDIRQPGAPAPAAQAETQPQPQAQRRPAALAAVAGATETLPPSKVPEKVVEGTVVGPEKGVKDESPPTDII